MQTEKPIVFKIGEYEVVFLEGRLEVSVPDEDIGTQMVQRFANAILDGKLRSLRINLPNKIIFVSAKNNQDLIFRADHADNKKGMN
jgi:hypothetical protein